MALTIGQLARAADVNPETIRYYEREGFLPNPPRTTAGYRQYDGDTVRRVRFMKRAQSLGFTLAEVGHLLELRTGRDGACANVVAEAHHTIARIETKIAELERMRTGLRQLIGSCHERRSGLDCPLLDALEDHT
ncbi:MAG TPA: MerR family transcriptional regulator [Gemmatimonadaceae bacterium]|nr:MerR family transcriptional regulator [Gemmatimonadaceae bacterium]